MTSYTRTTWSTGDIITAALANNWETGIHSVANDITEKSYTETTVTATIANLGSNFVEAPFSEMVVKGNTANGILLNGNFTDGSNWTPEGGVESVVDNIYSLTGNGISLIERVYQDTNTSVIIGNKIFVKAFVRVTNSDCNSLQLHIDGSTGGSEALIQVQVTPTANKWYELKGIATIGADFTGNVQIKIKATYADSATQNGKVLQVQNVVGVDLTAEGLDTLTVDQATDRFPYWFNGVVSTNCNLLQSVNKNIFPEKMTDGIYILTAGETEGIETVSHPERSCTEYYIRIQESKQYHFNHIGTGRSVYIFFYDINKNYILRTFFTNTATFTTPENASYIRFAFISTAGNFNTTDYQLQIEEGSIATDFVNYEDGEAQIPVELHSTPDGTCCSYNVNTGLHTKKHNKHVLQSNDIVSLVTSGSVDYVQIKKPTDFIGYGNNDIKQVSTFRLRNYGSGSANSSTWDDVSLINEMLSRIESNNFRLIIEKGTYADLAAAQADFAGTSVIYQLASSQIIKYRSQSLKAYQNGTIIITPFKTELLKYSSGISITDTTIPIKEMSFVYKINKATMQREKISLDDVTVAGNGLSLTITGASDDEYYEFGYAFDESLSTIPTITYSVSDNIAGAGSSNAQANANKNTYSQISDFAKQSVNADNAINATNAINADNATNSINANNADNATNAINANNANTLDNKQASDFVLVDDYGDNDVLTKIKNVDGAGSDLDADKLDGKQASDFVLDTEYTANDVLTKIKTVDGAGSGLDADTVDGVGVTGSGTQGLRKITISTANPSGGSDGDVWLKHAP